MNLKLILLSPVTAFYNFLIILPTSINVVEQGMVVLKRQIFLMMIGIFLGLKVTVLLTLGNVMYILVVLILKDELNKEYLPKVMERLFGYNSDQELNETEDEEYNK